MALKASAGAPPGGADDLGETVSEAVSKEVFSSYTCSSVDRGRQHPGDISEAASLRCLRWGRSLPFAPPVSSI